MPLQYAYDKNILESKKDSRALFDTERKIEEVEPTAAEKKAINISRKQFEKGEFISLDDLIQKYA